ncbi:MAG: outer membrane lipoprotein carrier protein LolA [Alistipes sp.]|jgi:hypothetical protein|nr:outer membrane lipoprotein carrier protein LolA [Alistipes sp.]
MKKIIITLTYIAATLVAATARGQEADFADRLRVASATTRTIECDFTLTRTMSFMVSDVVSSGRFHYLRGENGGGGIALDFIEPEGDRITMNPERFSITTGGKTSVVAVDSNPMLRQLQRMLTACMTGDLDMLREGSDIAFADKGDTFGVIITPKERRARSMVRRITLTFEKQHMSLTTLRMEEASGDVSQYKFFNKTFNGAVDPARFAI